jgi:hypothetical protein
MHDARANTQRVWELQLKVLAQAQVQVEVRTVV